MKKRTLSAVVLLSIGYSSFKNELAITNISSTVRIDKDIRVMGVKLNNSNKASSMYEDYNVANISFQGNLEEADSYLIYDVDVYNLGNVIMGIKSVDINNENKETSMVKKEEEEYDVMEQTNKMMSWMMPIMSVSISLVAPLGLALYWLVNNILMIGERLVLNKIIKD